MKSVPTSLIYGNSLFLKRDLCLGIWNEKQNFIFTKQTTIFCTNIKNHLPKCIAFALAKTSTNITTSFFSFLYLYRIPIWCCVWCKRFVRNPSREWVLTKVVNGERASYSAPKFARMQERTRSQMLEDIVANLANHAETGQIPKPYRRGSWRPIGEEPCILRVSVSCCMRLYVPHSMYLKHCLLLFLLLFRIFDLGIAWFFLYKNSVRFGM